MGDIREGRRCKEGLNWSWARLRVFYEFKYKSEVERRST
jgi:hypothetical protein